MIGAVTTDTGVKHAAGPHMLIPEPAVETFSQRVAKEQHPVRLRFDGAVDLIEASAGMTVLSRGGRRQFGLRERTARKQLRIGPVLERQQSQREKDASQITDHLPSAVNSPKLSLLS